MVAGCASSSNNAVPPSRPSQVPVRVSLPPSPPTSKAPVKPKTPPPDSSQDEHLNLGYVKALKQVKTYRRQPGKDEKVYPIDLSLKDADLVETIRALGNTMGINYLIDPRVKGKANVHASGKMTQTELLSILETVLLVNGAALVKEGKVYKIVPLDKSATQALPVYARKLPPVGMTVQVVFLEQTAAKEMASLLKPLMSPGGSISEAVNNSLVIVDYPANLEKIQDLMRLIDSRTLAQALIHLAKVKNTDPKELVAELEVIFSAYGTLAQKEKFGVSFLPVTRLNSILVLAKSKPLMNQALHWIRQLDLEGGMLANVHVYHVKNYKAGNLASILTQAYGGAAAAPPVKEVKTEGTPPSFLSQAGGSGASQTGLGGGMVPGGTGMGLGQQTPTAGGILAAPAKERAIPQAPAEAQAVSPKEGVRIVPDEENNLLVVVAPPHEWRIISQLLERLDIMPRQVLNEVLIAEVVLTGDLQYGIEWFINAQLTQPTAQAGQQQAPTLDILTGASAAFSTAIGGFTFAARDALNIFRGMIHMLAQDGKVNILASPHIMAANNQEARILIGQEVPILTSQAIPTTSQLTSFTTQTVQYRSTGIILAIKPQINAQGQVTLDLTQEVSNPIPTTSGVTSTPTFNIRQAKTSLITADNQTIVLGGLIRDDVTRTSYGIPALNKIPLLGPLFGNETRRREKTELLLLITPHIITNMGEGAHITHEVKERITLEGMETRPNQASPIAPPQQ